MGEQSQASGWQGVSDWYLSATCIACIVYCANMGNIMFLLHHFGSSPSAVENVVQINFILSIINIFATGMVIKLHLFYMVPRSCCFYHCGYALCFVTFGTTINVHNFA